VHFSPEIREALLTSAKMAPSRTSRIAGPGRDMHETSWSLGINPPIPSAEGRVSLVIVSSKPRYFQVRYLVLKMDVPSHLERLPPELRLAIFHLLELDDLKSLVHASPVYHNQYISGKASILRKCIHNVSQRLQVDLPAVREVRTLEFANARTGHTLENFIFSLHNRIDSRFDSTSVAKLTESELVEITEFLFTIVPFVQLYMEWAWSNFAEANGQEEDATRPLTYQPPSRTETTRILRGMYNFEILCNIAGPGRYNTLQIKPVTGEDHSQIAWGSSLLAAMFVRTIQPWEAEEIHSIMFFTYKQWEKLFKLVPWYCHISDPQFRPYPSPPWPPLPKDRKHMMNLLVS
jgi:hypothetical protein